MMEKQILKFICANQGAVDTEYLVSNLGCSVSEIISNRDKFVFCCPFGQPKVVARTRLRLCRAQGCQGSCGELHLCKSFLLSGSCQFLQSRTGCCFSHELSSDHNHRILTEHKLESLSRTELCMLLLQSDARLLPPICHDYNNGDGVFGRCKDGYVCKRLHICEKFLIRDCTCSRSHDFTDPQPLIVLQVIPKDLFHSLKAVYANIEALKYHNNEGIRGNSQKNRGNRESQGDGGQQERTRSTSDILGAMKLFDVRQTNEGTQQLRQLQQSSRAVRTVGRWGNQQLQRACSTTDISVLSQDGPDREERKNPARDKTNICMYFIKGQCKHQERCFKAHDKMPYRWQVRKDDQWTALPDNEMIEKDYCDPKKTYSSSSPPVCFDTMTCGGKKVRRLSTINSLLKPNFILTTEWLWYWEDNLGLWYMYGSVDGGHEQTDMDSSKLEQKFLDNPTDVVLFTAGSQSYSLSFVDMIQTNRRFGTKRLVKRRPRFVSAADVQTTRMRKPLRQMNLTALPDHWDKTQIPQTGYKLVPLERSSPEFQGVRDLFYETMRGFEIVNIERIQNKCLWEVFQLQKTQMTNNNGGRDVTEKKLFHGTDSKYLDTICHTNFDWRLCGTHGTAYGKGSYFARDAKYSHSYATSDSDIRSMFVVRLLVGDYSKGCPDYWRPPSKDGGSINFFDSCVDSVQNPTIYVVFEKHQIYPEYLLHYRKMNVDVFGTTSAPVPLIPVVPPKPSVAMKKALTNLVLLQPPPVPSLRPVPKPRTSLDPPSTSGSPPLSAKLLQEHFDLFW